MQVNIGNTDRILRAVVGALLVLLPLVTNFGGTLGWPLVVVGLVLLGTATMRFCPAYRLLGIQTCGR